MSRIDETSKELNSCRTASHKAHFGPFFVQAAPNSVLHFCCTWSIRNAAIISKAKTVHRFC